MTKPHIALVVDDEPDIRELLSITLQRMDIESQLVPDLGAAMRQLRQRPFDICLTDMKLPDGSGIDLVRFIQRHRPQVPVAVITAHGNVEFAVEALKAGAFDFVSKPVELGRLRALVDAALSLSNRHESKAKELIGHSAAIERTRSTVSKLSRSQAPVYISGESGTGKELAARLIHSLGPRFQRNFVPVNCGAIPPELMEAELFGYVKGSFTGAVADRPGLFTAAEGGTLFLDEVADLPLHMQVKLLRAIQEKSIRPVGAQREVPVNIRILSATHKNLGVLVERGEFRQDLYYRINVIELPMPPLRDRVEDIPVLATHIMHGLVEANTPMPGFAPDALSALSNYSFPGNVRELENILERAMTLCDQGEIQALDLGLDPALAADPVKRHEMADLDSQMVDLEKQTILDALEVTRWNKTAAAKRLGINFGALRYRMQKFGLE